MLKIYYEKRNNIGTYFSFKYRKNNEIPCIIYNKNENIKIYINKKYLIYIKNNYNNNKRELLLINNNLIYKVYIKEIQIHPINNLIIHIDFLIINKHS
ncbi:hypothetical protein [Candidatus Nardonella dryophthoridicola]|uniref:50S ribosomal protein L25 n=1 Tax=endosymbiont of Metamasius hemipterus TaxID=204627 RepID=A0ABT0TW42_9GAMM|nr:hypothetical protein [Candidatus Nardonella dryophthoridicola]MCM0158216.1 hypothetical protein [endosymbiont of Metamasius hemipterus]